MKHYSTKKRFCPHLIETKIKAVELFRQTHDVEYVMRKYHVGKASVYRWNRQYDGTRESFLENKSSSARAQPLEHPQPVVMDVKV